MRSQHLSVLMAFLSAGLTFGATSADFHVDVASYMGGGAEGDRIYGSAVLSDGTLVLAGCASPSLPYEQQTTVLNGATPSSRGVVIRLSADARSVQSVARVADAIVDVSTDGRDNMYCAAMDDGLVVLDAAASAVVHTRVFDKPVHRVDAGKTGVCAVLTATSTDFLSQKTTGATIHVLDDTWAELGSFGGNSHYTRDVAVHEPSQTVVTVGFVNYTTDGYPVDVPAYQGVSYGGTRIYGGYNYAPSELNANGSNMADARGHRCVIGSDGYLYMAFEVDGGNFVFDNDPFDVMRDVELAGGDLYHQGSNTGTEPSVFYGRYDPATGAYVKGQYFTTRLDNGRGNTVRIRNGSLAVSGDGTMYLGGASASGLPLTFDPLGGYTGGAYLLVVKNDFSGRLLCTRLSSGTSHTIALAPSAAGGGSRVLWAGTYSPSTNYSLYTHNALVEPIPQAQDGFVAFIPATAGSVGNSAPVAEFNARQVSGTTLEFDASVSADPDGDALSYIWGFNDGPGFGAGVTARHTYPGPISGTYRVALTVLDSRGGWSSTSMLFGPPSAGFALSPRTGQAPLTIAFDGSHTSDPDNAPQELQFTWELEAGQRKTGIAAEYTYMHPGLYAPHLYVADDMAGRDTTSTMVLVAEDEHDAIRFDFGTTGDRHEAGFTAVDTSLYTADRGYGWREMTGDVKVAGWDYHDRLCADAVQLNKYVDGSRFNGEFMVDLPNGEYTVLMHFMQKYSYGFPGVDVEGERAVSDVYVSGVANGEGIHEERAFPVTVSDGRMNFVFVRGEGSYGIWFVSAIQIVPGTWELTSRQTDGPGTAHVRVSRQNEAVRVSLFDARGRKLGGYRVRNWDGTATPPNVTRLAPHASGACFARVIGADGSTTVQSIFLTR
ncbi:MAG: PKD domain-containing protein [Chitinivibrionales bacterium]|nr:PKD domain-containing protein [Chitinivibrionales bacterium]